jgi:hypothetical protein
VKPPTRPPAKPGVEISCLSTYNTGQPYQHTHLWTRANCPKKCQFCGGKLVEREVYFGVVAWNERSRYHLDDCVYIGSSMLMAEARANRLYAVPGGEKPVGGYVVKTFDAALVNTAMEAE